MYVEGGLYGDIDVECYQTSKDLSPKPTTSRRGHGHRDRG